MGISQPLLCKLIKQRYEIETSIETNATVTRKRKRCGKEDVERALKEWTERIREKGARVDGPLLKMKSAELAQMMGKDNFCATSGWFTRWQKRENITYGKLQGETGEADSFLLPSRGYIMCGLTSFLNTQLTAFIMPTKLPCTTVLCRSIPTFSKTKKQKE